MAGLLAFGVISRTPWPAGDRLPDVSEDPAFVWNRPRRPRIATGSVHHPEMIDDRAAATGSDPADRPEVARDLAPRSESPDEPNAVLVPLDQWSRILNQLGNLHEAGQQLADARERAAKAETESEFLRERLREMRSKVELMEEMAAGPPPEPEPEPTFGVWFLRRQLQRRRRS